MNIGFDARMITHPGVGNYIRFLVRNMISFDSEDNFFLFGDTVILGREFGNNGNVEIVRWKAPIYSIAEQVAAPYERLPLDVLHVPHFNVPIRSKKRIVSTIHDLIYVKLLRSLLSFPAKKYASFMIKRSLEKACKVISVSNYTKNDILKTFGVKYADKISTVYEAPAIDYNRISDEKKLLSIRQKFGLEKQIILYVGSIKPHKNVGALIKACRKLKKIGMDCQLVIAGRWDKKEDRLKKEIDNIDVKYVGEVSCSELRELYSVADVFAQVSLCEGFGLPVLEAMQCEVPLVVSKLSAMDEIAGDAALPVDPYNIGQITDTIYNVLVNKRMRTSMIVAGTERLKMFSWRKTAEETMEVYRQALT